MRSVRLAAVVFAAFTAACSSATGALGGDLARHQADWQARNMKSYDYEFRQEGFFIRCTGEFAKVEVRAGVVAAATLVGSDQPATAPLSCWPTIDQLFERALAADQGGQLRRVTFDPNLGFPTRVEVSGPPDASGSYIATALEPKS